MTQMALTIDMSTFPQLCRSHCESQYEGQKPKWGGLMIQLMRTTSLISPASSYFQSLNESIQRMGRFWAFVDVLFLNEK